MLPAEGAKHCGDIDGEIWPLHLREARGPEHFLGESGGVGRSKSHWRPADSSTLPSHDLGPSCHLSVPRCLQNEATVVPTSQGHCQA